MTDGEIARVRKAFEVFKFAASKVKTGSDKWVHFVATCMVLGWVLDQPVYRDNFEVLLRELEGWMGERVVLEVPKG